MPCRQEHPILKALAEDERLTIVGINYKDRNDNALRFLGELGNPYAAIGVDPEDRPREAFQAFSDESDLVATGVDPRDVAR